MDQRNREIATRNPGQETVLQIIAAICQIVITKNWVLKKTAQTLACSVLTGAATLMGSILFGRTGMVLGPLVAGAFFVHQGQQSDPVRASTVITNMAESEKLNMSQRIAAILKKHNISITIATALVVAILENREALKEVLEDLKQFFKDRLKMTVVEEENRL